jgi:hypothetical protein
MTVLLPISKTKSNPFRLDMTSISEKKKLLALIIYVIILSLSRVKAMDKPNFNRKFLVIPIPEEDEFILSF